MLRFSLERFPIPVRVAIIYAAFGSAWIVISDCAMAYFLGRPGAVWLAEMAKGLVFVAATSLILFQVLRRYVGRWQRSERALRASDARWRFALEGAGDGVWDWDDETKTLFCSEGWKTMFGYAEGEIGNRYEEWEKLIHPDDLALVREQYRRHVSGEYPAYECEHRLRTKAGGYKWVLARGRVITRDAAGRPIRAVGTHTDITAHKEAEAKMADALNFQQTILRTAPVGIITYRADGRAVSANEAAAKFVGARVEDLLAQNFHDLASWQKQGLEAAADRALAENRVVFHEGKVTSTFGRTTWAEMTFSPFRYDGEQRLLLIVQDVTEQRATVERMKLLQAALEAAPVGWVVTDAHGITEWVNPGFTKLTGYALEETVGRKMSLLKSGRHPEDFYKQLWRTIREGRIWQGELYNRRKNGSCYFERMTIAPVRDAEGVIVHFLAMKEDVTGQHELEQKLVRSQRLESVGLLASGLAHDLNNMLSPILLSVGLIKTRTYDAETHELLDMMQKSAQRGAGVVQQILTFARGVEGDRVQLDVRPLVKELGQLARETFPRGIRVAVDVSSEPLLVDGDITQLHQVLLNLAVNARDAMPDGGVLTLKAGTVILDEEGLRAMPGGKPGRYVKLVVADTGTGITPEVLEHLFEPFFSTKPRGKGTGLGLSTVYGIVRSHGGSVDVQSSLGEGTEFSVLLPVSTTVPTALPVGVRATTALSGAGRYVLVVDDEAGIRRVLAQVLGKHGFVAIEAEDGVQGLRLLRAHPARFCVAIVDLMMPGMNGYRMIAEIRQIEPGLPVIVASGMMGDFEAGQDVPALAALGVRTVLKKPFFEEELMKALAAETRVDGAKDAGQNGGQNKG